MSDIFIEIVEKKHPELPVLSILQGTGTVLRNDSERRITYDKSSLCNYKVMMPGDFIIHLRSFEGGLECANHYGISSPAYKVLRTENLIPEAYKDYFRSYRFVEGKLSVAVTGIRDGKSIDMPSFWEIQIPVPTMEEQRKIAWFLSLVNKRIQKQQQLIDALKSYKRGLSEALFSQIYQAQMQGISNWPTYRFGDLGFFYNGLSGKSKEDFGIGCASYIPYMNVFSNPVADDAFLEPVRVAENERQNSVAFGDLLFTQSSETFEEVGYSSVWLGKKKTYLNSFCFGFRFYDLESVDPLFIAHYFRSSAIRNAIMREGQGATRVNLSAERLKNMEIKLPDKTTQQYIGQLLQNIQQLIKCAEIQLTELMAIKNGLLQQLFI